MTFGSQKKLFFTAIILLLVIAGVFTFVNLALAQAETNFGLDTIGGSGLAHSNLIDVIVNFIRIFLGIIGIVLLILILYAGFLWMTASGEESKIEKAKKIIISAVIGLIIVLSAFSIASFVINLLKNATGTGSGNLEICTTPGETAACGPNNCGTKVCQASGYWSVCDTTTPQCGLLSACVATKITPKDDIALRNVVVRFFFNHPLDQNTIDISNLKVTRAGATLTNGQACTNNNECLSESCDTNNHTCNGDTVGGSLVVTGSVAAFTPSTSCPGPFGNLKCFSAAATYNLAISGTAINCGGYLLDCSLSPSQCVGSFSTGTLIDAAAPTVRVQPGSICKPDSYWAGTNNIRAIASDDAGVAYVDFFANSQAIGTDPVDTNSSAPIVAQVNWNASGVDVGERVQIKAKAYDHDSNSAENTKSFTVRPGHCCNGTRDAGQGEEGIDCGGDPKILGTNYCGACAGVDCDADRNLAACQPDDDICHYDCWDGSCKCVEPPIINYLSPADDPQGDSSRYDPATWSDDLPNGAPNNFISILGKNFSQIGSLLVNTLTYVDFEAGSLGGLPPDWYKLTKSRSTVGISDEEYFSGSKSVKIWRSANEPPNNWQVNQVRCSEDLCNGVGVYLSYPYKRNVIGGVNRGCEWDSVNNICDFPDQPMGCSAANHACKFNNGSLIDWPYHYTNNYVSFYYDISSLDFNLGDKYILRFKYKGILDRNASVKIAYSADDWASQSWPKAMAGVYTDNNCVLQGGVYCASNPGRCGCTESTSNCCVNSPIQTKPFNQQTLTALVAGNYTNWQEYEAIFTYTSEIDRLKDRNGNPHRLLIFNIADSQTGANGTNLYLDDFIFARMPTQGEVRFCGADTDGNGDPCDDADDKLGKFPSELNNKCESTWVDNQIIIAVPPEAVSGPIRVKNEFGYTDVTNNYLGPLINDFNVNSRVRPSICLMQPGYGANPNATGAADNTDIYGVNFPLATAVAQNLIWYLKEWNQNTNAWSFANVTTSPSGVTQPNWASLKITETVPANKIGWADVSVYNGAEFSNHYLFLLSSGAVGQPCGWVLGDTCNPNVSICRSGLTCNTTSCTCEVITACDHDGIIDSGEECDGANLNNTTCKSLGFTAGTVSCDSSCRLIKNCSRSEGWGSATQALFGWAFSTTNFVPPVENLCGNGRIDWPEECDGDLFRVNKQCNQVGCQAACSSSCKADCSACGGKWPSYSATQGIYAWSFLFGGNIIYDDLYVVEECQRGLSCSLGSRLGSPTPWSDGWTLEHPGVKNPQACLNAVISARFDVGVRVASFCGDNNFTEEAGIYTCTNPAQSRLVVLKCNNREGSSCVRVTSGALKVKTDNNDRNKDYFVFTPTTNLDPGSWYKVVLLQGISSEAGKVIKDETAASARAEDRFCKVNYGGGNTNNAAYCWNFETRADDDSDKICPEGCVECSPDPSWMYWPAAETNYSANLDSADNACLILNPNSYSWSWSTDTSNRVQLDDRVGAEEKGLALNETMHDNPKFTKVIASLNSAGKNDYCEAHIDFTNPYIVEDDNCSSGNIQSPTPWPNSRDAYINAMLGVRFSKNMFNGSLVAGSFILQKCGSETEFNVSGCDEEVNLSSIDIFSYSPEIDASGLTREEIINRLNLLNEHGLPEGVVITPSSNFDAFTWYRIIILGGENGVRGEAASGLSEGILMTDNSFNEEVRTGWDYIPSGQTAGDGQDDYYWIFKTGNQLGKINSVSVNPHLKFMPLTDDTQIYKAWPQAANCNILNPASYVWNWRSLIKLADDSQETNSTGGTGIAVAGICNKDATSCDGYADPAVNTTKVFAKTEGDTNIKARAKNTRDQDCSWNDSNCGDRWGFGQLFIGFENLRITSRYPSCDNSGVNPNYISEGICTNSVVGLDFSLDVDMNTFLANDDIILFKEGAVGGEQSLTITEPTAGSQRYTKNIRLTRSGGDLLDSTSTYRVVVKGGADGVIAWNGKQLASLNYVTGGRGEDCDKNAYPWNTVSGVCTDNCLLNPASDLCNISGGRFKQCSDTDSNNAVDYCDTTCHNLGNNNTASCGDGLVKAGIEECDDGNTTGDDGCGVDCKLEGANQKYGSLCGNKKIETGEGCDDGNTSSGDGCDSKCLPESGRPAGSRPNAPICGNGKIESGESCDDGNTTGGDGCGPTCLRTGSASGAVCGNGKVETGQPDSYSWRFKTLDKPCEVGRVQVLPQKLIINSVGVLPQAHWANPYSASSACNKEGQLLSPICYNWSWGTWNRPLGTYYSIDKYLPPDAVRNNLTCAAGGHPLAWGANYKALDSITDGLIQYITAKISGGKSCGDTGDCGELEVQCSFCNTGGERDLDNVCSDINNKGVGKDCCCHWRPIATPISPTNICPNEVIDIKFTAADGSNINMDMESLTTTTMSTLSGEWNNLNVRLYESPVPSGLNIFGLGKNNFLARFLLKAGNVLAKLFGQGLPAQANPTDLIPIKASAVNLGGATHLLITPQRLLDKNKDYVVWVNGDGDTGDGSRRGVLSQWGVSMSGDKLFTFHTLNQEYCRVEKVFVYAQPPVEFKGPVTDDTFFCKGDDCGKNTSEDLLDDDVSANWNTNYPAQYQAANLVGNQHFYWAKAADVTGNHILNANYKWEIVGPRLLAVDNSSSPQIADWNQTVEGFQSVFVTAYGNNTVNGSTAVRVTASGVVSGAGSAATSVFERVFICDNPWPQIGDFPFRDFIGSASIPAATPITNFETYYCRDRGEAALVDDLPSLNRVAISGREDIIKEFLLTNKDNPLQVKDRVGFNNLAILGSVELVTGEQGRAAKFLGRTADYLTAIDASGNPTNPFNAITGELTVSALVNLSEASLGAGRVIAGNYYWNSNPRLERGWLLGKAIGQEDSLDFIVFDASGNTSLVKYDNFFRDYGNKWVKITAAFKPGKYLKIFINGIQVAKEENNIISGVAYQAGVPFRIGHRADTADQGMWQGYIDEVKIYNKAEPQTDDDGLISYYSFEDASDAIGLRVIKNPNHYSPLVWYQQTFDPKKQGQPKSLTVDGYQAVSEGRTTYVAGADLDNNANNIYTSIYLVSYSQDASGDTKEIYKQLVNNFQLNAGVTADINGGLQDRFGSCSKDNSKKCLVDNQCSKGGFGYCSSDKAKLTRDAKRISDIQEFNLLLDNYYNQKRCANDHQKLCYNSFSCYGGASCGNYYPPLLSGTYVVNRTYSVWPSWQATLANALGKALPADPLNKLEGCAGDYDPATCWDKINKKMQCPTDAYVYSYYVLKDPIDGLIGKKKNIFANGEYNKDGTKWLPAWSSVELINKNTDNANIFGGLNTADFCH
ncbi:MAG: LamG-like jellyroll fold domain-containing protein [Patescibacteria group bacterium]